MIRDFKWRVGFLIGVLLILWAIVLLFILSSHLSLGPALGLFFLTVGVFILMALLMVLCVFFRQTRPFSFGLALPLLVLQIGLLILTYFNWGPRGETFLVNLPGCMALLVVGIAYLSSVGHSGGAG